VFYLYKISYFNTILSELLVRNYYFYVQQLSAGHKTLNCQLIQCYYPSIYLCVQGYAPVKLPSAGRHTILFCLRNTLS